MESTELIVPSISQTPPSLLSIPPSSTSTSSSAPSSRPNGHLSSSSLSSMSGGAPADSVDRSDWARLAASRFPQYLEVKERTDPLSRTITFCKHFHPGARDVKEGLDRSMVLSLILQHLKAKGLKDTVTALEKEARLKAPSIACVAQLRRPC
eukprot:TRINITY_DN36634_c0_g1_i1.p1 TRINITY_DN36634_c0_g1~~TRINITY_DN36634_c0_g1_i1.p1  ORF type:complete len:152 (-),score=28.04 TRINITY_DN36634_c0_g1_i1:93-548(-)